jgi:hypothetical protein
MKCKTVKQMQKIAQAGALKMPEQGYSVEEITVGGGPAFEVTNPEGKTYQIDLTRGEGGYCTCPFHKENRHLKGKTCCKHTMWVSWMIAKKESAWWHELGRELVRNGGGLGQPEITSDAERFDRLAAMFPHQFETARLS